MKIEAPWSLEIEEIEKLLEVSIETGLSSAEAEHRLKTHGRNQLKRKERKGAGTIFIEQFKNLIIALLAAASVPSFLFGQPLEGYSIIAVILTTVAIGFFTELKAVRSMEALRKMSRITARVRRNSDVINIPAEKIVPGDVIVVEGGDIITADVRIVESSRLQVDESALTGESVPVAKNSGIVDPDVHLAERKNMLYKGTSVTRGSGEGIAVATGLNTELGRISELVELAESEVTPLEQRLTHLAYRLIWVTLFITAGIAALGIVQGRGVLLMITTAVALAVAAIPEGLPIVTMVALARGMLQMARRNALINRLASVETLGATHVIFTDKTGTLTKNQMTVTKLVLDSGSYSVRGKDGAFLLDGEEVNPGEDRLLFQALKTGILCNNADLPDDGNGAETGVGDPLEVALLVAGARGGMRREKMIQDLPEEREEAFDTDTKKMATFHRTNGRYFVAVKGAPEAMLEISSALQTEAGSVQMDDQAKDRWNALNREMAREGLRVIALGYKETDSVDENPYEGIRLLGLVGLWDPPRPEIRQSIGLCRRAGIRVIMVTGDQKITAGNVARTVGIVDEEDPEVIDGKELRYLSEKDRTHLRNVSIFARVTPEQKLDLISAYQERGMIVAMTGDGVNDAPALKKADIGVAMGRRGTEVAREAADMVLKDDSFSTIITAVEYGRIIFNNIRKFVIFLLSGNVGEVLAVAVASLLNAPLPLRPLQILYLNLILDVFPALALGLSAGHTAVMKRPPRNPKEPILTRQLWIVIFAFGVIIAASILGALFSGIELLGVKEEVAVTMSFLTLAFARLWHTFNMRDPRSGLFNNEVTRNKFVWGALALCFSLSMAVFLPGLSTVLKVRFPDASGWIVIIGFSLVPLVIGQIGLSIPAGLKRP